MFPGLRRVAQRVTRQPRAHPRLMMSEPVRIRPQFSGELPAIMEDVSAGGACIRTHVRLKPGDSVNVLMTLGAGLRFDARARVVYALKGSGGYQARYGLRFVGMPETDVASISEFIVDQRFGRRFGVRPTFSETQLNGERQ